MEEAASTEARYNFRAAIIVGSAVGAVSVLLAGRFVLTLLGASSESTLVGAIYAVSAPLVAPLYGVLGSSAMYGAYFETAALVAIACYALIALGLMITVRIMTEPVAPGGYR